MGTNELELNRWAHSFVDGDQHNTVQVSRQVMWGDKPVVGNAWKCRKCGYRRDRQSDFEKFDCDIPIPDYCSSLDLAAKVEAKAIELVGWLKYSEAIWDLLIAEVSFSILRWPAIMRRYTTLPALTRVQAAKRAVEGK